MKTGRKSIQIQILNLKIPKISYRSVLPVNRSKTEFQNLGRKMAKITRRTIDDETEGLVSGEAVDAK
jgi:hypothetical protein